MAPEPVRVNHMTQVRKPVRCAVKAAPKAREQKTARTVSIETAYRSESATQAK
jgi:hypothetical protein